MTATAAQSHRTHATPAIAKFICSGEQESCAAHAHWMTQCNGTAVHIDDARINTQFADGCQPHTGKRLVDLHEIYVVDREFTIAPQGIFYCIGGLYQKGRIWSTLPAEIDSPEAVSLSEIHRLRVKRGGVIGSTTPWFDWIFESTAETMREFLDHMINRYQTIENWALTNGLAREEIELLRNTLTNQSQQGK